MTTVIDQHAERAAPQRVEKSAQTTFHVCTLVTDCGQYREMVDSFRASGFIGPGCEFSAFDNSSGNRFEPYGLLNELLAASRAKYLVLCHQDVRLDQGDGFETLQARLEELEKHDPGWAVAGVAGCTDDFEFVLRCRDPNGFALWNGPLPLMVNSLDECFLVIRAASGVRVSKELSGFHLYGTDLCLNARLARHSCWVVNFRLTHLSAGRFDADFMKSRTAFMARWNREFRALWIIREAEIFLSRHAWLHRWGAKVRVKRFMRSRRWLRWWMTRELPRPRGS